MSISHSYASTSLLTPPPSPGGLSIPFFCLPDPEALSESLSEYASTQLLHLQKRTLAPIEDFQDGSCSRDYTRGNSGELSLTELPLEKNPLPQVNSRSNLLCSDGFRRRPGLKTYNTGSSSKSSGSIRSPDRFLPSRSPLDAAFQRFHTGKESSKLSPSERLLRHEIASEDAFSSRQRATSPNTSIMPTTTGHTTSAAHVRGEARRICQRVDDNVLDSGPSALTFRRDSDSANGERHVSLGSTWTVGGLAPLSVGVSNGRGGLIGSGTNAPLYTTSFSSSTPKTQVERAKHEGRLAKALELDRTQRVFEFVDQTISNTRPSLGKRKRTDIELKTTWNGTEWVSEGFQAILDAPSLRDDFYCSVLAYSPTCHTLAVGLGAMLYAWSDKQGVHLLHAGTVNGSWLTSIAFSSTQGCKCILAYGRSDGRLTLMSLYDRPIPRFEVQQPFPIACVTWRPTVSLRQSRAHRSLGMPVQTEDLIVGDESGNVYYYSVEWPEAWEVDTNGWPGVMTLLARISIHSQQICGLAWSNDGSMLATGGNDNLCCLFKASRLLQPQIDDSDAEGEVITAANGMQRVHSIVGQGGVKIILAGAERHRWIHGAAVKAIAFCPWRDGLVATGGGSNDKCIHFFHTVSGACLATISVAAQVTSLIWSTTRREIAATFGYAQPEHPYRIAVFSWPDCKQVAAIPWEGEHRALYAIPYPGGPNESRDNHEGGSGMSRTAQEGCIVVAASDESVKFHEVWSAARKATIGGEGMLGGSDILEGLEGIDKEGDIIR